MTLTKKRGKAKKQEPEPKYRYGLYQKHPSGIGARFTHWVYTNEKPSYETGFFWDATNGNWGKDI